MNSPCEFANKGIAHMHCSQCGHAQTPPYASACPECGMTEARLARIRMAEEAKAVGDFLRSIGVPLEDARAFTIGPNGMEQVDLTATNNTRKDMN